MEPAIRIDGLWKEYVLGGVARHGTFYEALSQSLAAPFRRFRELAGSDRERERFWALRELSLEVAPGEVLGVIGRNGAGKSTLLKILTRITEPTRGRIEIRGRVASLLEVGTGFHPELTGRENVYLNGAILGMTRGEIARKFDEIVAFAEIERFLDTPVKRYSSGMYVRLAFAVAAHLDADVLLVDEVLAVGDTEFQRRCLGSMRAVSDAGRTVIFVSHNLGAVRNLCRSVLLLENGAARFRGAIEEGVGIYEGSVAGGAATLTEARFRGPLADRLRFMEIVFRQRGEVVTVANPEEELEIELRGAALRSFPTLELSVAFFREGFHLASCHDAPPGTAMREGVFLSRFRLGARVLTPGRYLVGAGAVAATGDWTWGSDVAALDLADTWGDASLARDRGSVCLPYSAERVQ